MDNSDGNKVIVKHLEQRFMMLKERQEDTHRRFLEQIPYMRERENQELNHASQFLKTTQPTATNKTSSKSKQYSGASNKMNNTNTSTANADQQQQQLTTNNNNNNKSNNFTNGPNQSDLLQSVSILFLLYC
eukprot:TCONS_00051889-protein